MARPLPGATPSAASRRQPPPLTLYLHLPWCVQKCPYCDFNSHALRTTLPEAAYVDALLADAALAAPAVAGRSIVAVFIGGGTPSLFSASSLQRLLTSLSRDFELARDAEITLEANPGTVEHGDLAGYRAAGINRLSLGAQSFDAAALTRLGRIHGPDDIQRVVAEARAAGFDNLNLDIMYGLPRQTPAQALADVGAAIDLGPEHISHYQLTLEPNTVFYSRPPPLPDDDTVYTMLVGASETLAQAGYSRYEVSAYARAGRDCRHNVNYWRYGDYLGLGAGAHGKLTAADGSVIRTVKPSHPRAYLETAGTGR
ncbi:MAG: radical SAM family heme chaperone HemW, partial [Pseudomonadota bacterium]